MIVRLTLSDKTGFQTAAVNLAGEKVGELENVHPTTACAGAEGCAIHNRPSDHPLKDAPLFWRQDRGILERQCEHGVGHPDADAAKYLTSIGREFENIHGCDGCC